MFEFPDKLSTFFEENGTLKRSRFKVAYGGRGSGKSYFYADILLLQCYISPKTVVCAREFQNSMDDSVFALLYERAKLHFGDFFYEYKNCLMGRNGSKILFKGLARNIQSIKSLHKVDICWVEEAQSMSAKSWEILGPTIRADDSEIWISFNPDSEDDIVYRSFVLYDDPDSITVKVDYLDNPFLPQVLKNDAFKMMQRDYSLYEHIWLGGINNISEAQVFHGKWRVENFETPQETTFYFGADWSNGGADPHTLVRNFIKGNTLFIDYEYYGRCDIDTLPMAWASVPQSKEWKIRCDSAQPALIQYMHKRGYKTDGAPKQMSGGRSSISEGISYIRSFDEVVIHPRCINVAKEFNLYKYKIDPRSGDITPLIDDKHNHTIDALRYSLAPMIFRGI